MIPCTCAKRFQRIGINKLTWWNSMQYKFHASRGVPGCKSTRVCMSSDMYLRQYSDLFKGKPKYCIKVLKIFLGTQLQATMRFLNCIFAMVITHWALQESFHQLWRKKLCNRRPSSLAALRYEDRHTDYIYVNEERWSLKFLVGDKGFWSISFMNVTRDGELTRPPAWQIDI